MIPLTICLENCNELIPDARRRILSSEARKFAEGGFRPRTRFKHSYGSPVPPISVFDLAIAEHERLFWRDAYFRRITRLSRMAKTT